jgi:RNA polymerase sigma-70 factor (ECF subfamily)
MVLPRPSEGECSRDLEDFNELYVRHARNVLAYFARRVHDPEVALDLTAETFAQALAGRHRLRRDGEDDAARWLFGIAHHLFTRYARRGRLQTRARARLGVELPAIGPDEYARIEELAGTERLRATVRRAFDELPAQQRDAVQLRVLDELPYVRVAAELNISEQAARMRVSRALRWLATRSRVEAEDPA